MKQLRLAAIACALLAAAPGIAAAQGTGTSTASGGPSQAIEHFKAAKAFYRDGKYIEALVEFKKAYDIQPTAALSYNIARCYEQLGQYKEAIATYERFMKETEDARERAEALDKIEFLQSKLAPDAASPEARYKARIEEGKKAFARGDYEGAIEEFKAAFDIIPRAGVLFNVGKAYERMGRYEDAIDNYTQYLDQDPNATDRPDVEETIRRLKKSIRERYQELSVSSDPPGADVYLDDGNTGLQGQTNFRFKVTPGPHTLILQLNGYETVKRDFVMPDDKPLALEFQLKKLSNVGYADIQVNVDGARIFIDGAIVGLSPYKQPKALAEGEHQVVIEARGYPRWTGAFVIQRDKNTLVDVKLEEYSEPIKDETLSKWGRNFLLIGLIGGTLGFVGPFAYQKIFERREINEALGPERTEFGGDVTDADALFWKGTPADGQFNNNYRDNPTKNTLEGIQLWSAVGGGTLAAVGLGFYMYMWFRPEEKVDVITAGASPPGSAPVVEIQGFGLTPTSDGAAFGLSGSF